MSSGDRFYLLEFRNRPVLNGDIGSLLKIDGLVVSGGGASAVLLLPTASSEVGMAVRMNAAIYLSDEEWSDYIRRSDNPEVLVGNAKVFHRKVRYEISGAVQQKIWVADGLKCMYCDKKMGDVQLTIDHFIPLELGGQNNDKNYLSACRRCNKDKGSEDPKEFCKRRNVSYDALVTYLVNRKVK